MKAYNIGLFIKKKREEQHIRQEDLCRGICDKSTLSRIERGKQEPSSGIPGVLLQRLGINEDQLAVLLGPKDFEISDLQKEIVALNSQKEYEKAAEKIRRLEQLVEPTDRIKSRSNLFCDARRWHISLRIILPRATCFFRHFPSPCRTLILTTSLITYWASRKSRS